MYHLFETGNRKAQPLILFTNFFSFSLIELKVPSRTVLCSTSNNYLFCNASAWELRWFFSISCRAYSHSICLSCSPQQPNYLSRERCTSSMYLRLAKISFSDWSWITMDVHFGKSVNCSRGWGRGSIFLVFGRSDEGEWEPRLVWWGCWWFLGNSLPYSKWKIKYNVIYTLDHLSSFP